MTAKDLHFSFDRSLAQVKAPPPATPRKRKPEPPATRPAAPARRSDARTGDASARRAWVTACLVALVNMAFLVLAALWLTGNTYQWAGLPQPASLAGNRSPDPALTDLQASIEGMAREVEALRAALASQSDLLLDIRAQLAGALLREDTPQAGAASAAVPEDIAAAERWHINLGSFATAESATRLQKQLAAMGYDTQVGTPGQSGDAAYRVWIGGYENREAADRVALRLMDQTDLTGLWVWNGH